MRHIPRENWQKSVEDIKKRMEHYKNTTFVLSCSAVTKEMHPRNNLYMWGHYGNGHKGVAIELDTRKASSLLRWTSTTAKKTSSSASKTRGLNRIRSRHAAHNR